MKKQIWILFIVGLVITSVLCSFGSLSSTNIDHSEERIEPVSKNVAAVGSQLCSRELLDGDGDIPEDVDPDGLEG